MSHVFASLPNPARETAPKHCTTDDKWKQFCSQAPPTSFSSEARGSLGPTLSHMLLVEAFVTGIKLNQVINVLFRSWSRDQDKLWGTKINWSTHQIQRRCGYVFVLWTPKQSRASEACDQVILTDQDSWSGLQMLLRVICKWLPLVRLHIVVYACIPYSSPLLEISLSSLLQWRLSNRSLSCWLQEKQRNLALLHLDGHQVESSRGSHYVLPVEAFCDLDQSGINWSFFSGAHYRTKMNSEWLVSTIQHIFSYTKEVWLCNFHWSRFLIPVANTSMGDT